MAKLVQGIFNADNVNWCIIMHIKSDHRVSNHVIMDENVTQQAIDRLASLTDWNASAEELCQQKGLLTQIEAVFKLLQAK